MESDNFFQGNVKKCIFPLPNADLNPMKFKTNLPISLSLLLLLLLFSACGGGESSGTEGDASTDGGELIKVEPQDFPVNNLPDAWFGKAATTEVVETLEAVEANIGKSEAQYPEWLDAIVSRESIVSFASQVLSQMPEELEFVQSSQQHYSAPDGWSAFKVMFNTRPSNGTIFVYGAYRDEEHSFWTSEFSKEPVSLQVMAVVPGEGGVAIHGLRDDQPFKVDLDKEKVKVTTQGS